MIKFITLNLLLFLIIVTNAQTPQLLRVVDSLMFDIYNVAPANGKVFFGAKANNVGYRPWVTDGTPAGTKLLKAISGGSYFTEYNNKTYFIGADSVGYNALWVTDGSTAGTSKFFAPNPTGNGVNFIIGVKNGKLYFSGNDGIHGYELWVTDGTVPGTMMLKDIVTGSGPGVQYPSTCLYNGKLYFQAIDSLSQRVLWVTDGTSAGTQLFLNAECSNFMVFNNNMFFISYTNTEGEEIWESDGTTSGTHLFKDIVTGTGSSFPSFITIFNNKLYFTTGLQEPYQMWVTDGTDAGTVPFADSATRGYVYNNNLYFSKVTGYQIPFYKYGLYKTDGTQAGITLVRNLTGGNSQRIPGNFNVCNGKMYFTEIYDGIGGGGNYLHSDLWISDGSAANTNPIVTDSIVDVYRPSGLTNGYGSLYFVSGDLKGLYIISGPNTTGFNTINTDSYNLLVYPNPAANIVNIKNENTVPITHITITDISGKIIQQLECAAPVNNYAISIDGYEAGIYMATVYYTNKNYSTVRFVKQ